MATRVGRLPEVVHDGRTGLLVPPADPGALAGAIADLLIDADRRRAMAVAARLAFDEEYDLAAIVRQTLAVYDLARSRNGKRR